MTESARATAAPLPSLGGGNVLGLAAGAALALVAVALPVDSVARALAGPRNAAVPDLQAGVWLLKVVLALLALACASLGRLVPRMGVASWRSGYGPSLTSSDVPARHAWLLVGLLLASSATLRLFDLGDGLWFDEIDTLVSYARLPLVQLLGIFESQNQHMLYLVAVKALFAVFGESEWLLRLPAVLFGVASVAATYWFGTLLTTRREALLAAAFLTFSYHHVWFSQNARGYTGLLLWTLVSSGAFLRLLHVGQPLERNRVLRWIWVYAFSAAAALYTNLSAAVVVAAHGVVILTLAFAAWNRGVEVVRPLLAAFSALVLAGLVTLALYAVVLPETIATALRPTMAGTDVAWKSPMWFLSETLRGFQSGLPGGLIALGIVGAVLVAGTVSFWRRSGAGAAVMLLPGAILITVLAVVEHNLWPRLFFFLAGFAAMIGIRGGFALCELLAGRFATRVAVVGAAALVLASAKTVRGAWHPKQDYAGAARWVATQRGPGDAVVTSDMTGFVSKQYLIAPWDSIGGAAALAETERNHPRTWIVYSFPIRLASLDPTLWDHLQRHYRTAAVFRGTLGDGEVYVAVGPASQQSRQQETHP